MSRWDAIDERAAREAYTVKPSTWDAHDEHRERHGDHFDIDCPYCCEESDAPEATP